MTTITDNTFAAACYDQNDIASLELALRSDADTTDMKTWYLSESEYYAQIQTALSVLKSEQAN